MRQMQRLVQLLYPNQCLTCDEMVEKIGGFCPQCWSDMTFTKGFACERCARPMVGEVEAGDICDSCLQTPPPWKRGRSVFAYKDNGLRFISQLKHGDKSHLAHPASIWMAEAAKPLMSDNTILVPVPLHWTRGLKRRFNQSTLLTYNLSKVLKINHYPAALTRNRATRKLTGLTNIERRQELHGAISTHPKGAQQLVGRDVLLVDDVLTTGATLTECAQECLKAGAAQVNVLTLGVVAKDV